MWKILTFFVLCCTILSVSSFGEMLGPGRWNVLNVLQCEDYDQYEVILEVSRKKVNRTHDCFSLHLDLDREVNFSYAAEVVVYKEMDGGFKHYTTMTDDCACTFLKKYTGENFERVLTMAGIDPPDCPVLPGEVIINDFVLDYTQLNENGVYGTYDVSAYLLYEGVRVTCCRQIVNFDKLNEEDDDDDDYD